MTTSLRRSRTTSTRPGRGTALAAAAVVAFLALAGCTSDPEPEPTPSSSQSPTATTEPEPEESETAEPGPDPTEEPAGVEAPPEPGTLPTAPPVALDEVADFGTGVTTRVDSVDGIEAQAQGPGEVSGPGVAIDLTVTNDSPDPVDLALFLVNLTDADGNPGIPMLGDPADPVEGVLAPGASVSGTYVFTVDEDARDGIRIEASYSTAAPVVVFAGDVSAR